MEVILLKDIAGVGKAGERVQVKDGHALNFLIPKGLADRVGGAKARAVAGTLKKRRDEAEQTHLALLERAKTLEATRVTLKAKAHGTQLYGGIHKADIAAALGLDAKYVVLEQPIKMIGEHAVVVRFDAQTSANVTVFVEPA